jgi:hypothetical protein
VAGGPTTDWDETLRPWRRASAAISIIQTPAMAGAFLLVFFAGDSTHVWAFVAAAVVVLLDVVQWGLARAALRRVPDSFPSRVYSSLPLDQRDRRLVSAGLVSGPIGLILLLAEMPDSSFFQDELGAAAVLLIAAGAPSFLALYRVWRHNAWTAVSRIPGQPRQAHPRYRDPDAI